MQVTELVFLLPVAREVSPGIVPGEKTAHDVGQPGTNSAELGDMESLQECEYITNIAITAATLHQQCH